MDTALAVLIWCGVAVVVAIVAFFLSAAVVGVIDAIRKRRG